MRLYSIYAKVAVVIVLGSFFFLGDIKSLIYIIDSLGGALEGGREGKRGNEDVVGEGGFKGEEKDFLEGIVMSFWLSCFWVCLVGSVIIR